MHTVIVSPRARSDYFDILKRLKEKWTVKEIKNFDKKFDKAIVQIGLNPLAFEAYKGKNIRRFVLDKHNIIFYRVKKNNIEIITIWASKTDPERLKL